MSKVYWAVSTLKARLISTRGGIMCLSKGSDPAGTSERVEFPRLLRTL